jgi:peptidoglycan hydrolase-like protein with peptidoglycan-binding domain
MAEQPDLVPGHTGEWVTYLQQLLTHHGAGSGFQDATYCATTESSVRELQRRHGLAETGRCDGATWQKLTAEPAPAAADGEELTIAFSAEDQVEAPEEQVDLTEVDQLPDSVAVS